MLRGDLPTPAQARLLEAALVAAVDHGPHAPSIAIARMAVDLRPADQQCDGVGDQCAGRCPRRRRPAMHGAVSRRSTQAQAGGEADRRGGRRVLDALHRGARQDRPRLRPSLAPASIRAPRRCCELVDAGARRGRRVAGAMPRIGARGRSGAAGARKGKPIPMNIDGATAVIFCELGFAPALGRGLFILSRSVGILAHAWEQMQQGGRIKGPMPPDIPYHYTGRRRDARAAAGADD